jgi:hypothetical protein
MRKLTVPVTADPAAGLVIVAVSVNDCPSVMLPLLTCVAIGAIAVRTVVVRVPRAEVVIPSLGGVMSVAEAVAYIAVCRPGFTLASFVGSFITLTVKSMSHVAEGPRTNGGAEGTSW